jgi:fibronectin type 3 domain-containing protein
MGTPNIPTGLAATPANGQITLNWNAVSGATSYGVYQQTSSTNFTKLAQPTTNSYVVTGLTNGQSYTLCVSAIN